jgi:hypothetical protein
VWQTIALQASALLLGAVGGGIISALVAWRMLRAETAQNLLRDALTIQAEMEAWILEGPGYENERLSQSKGLPMEPTDEGRWLRQVEVRAVLDEASWNAPEDQAYGFIVGRRVWIVRDTIVGRPVSHGEVFGGWHPALLSSRALEELCGWVERVSTSSKGRLLSKRDLETLKPLLGALCTTGWMCFGADFQMRHALSCKSMRRLFRNETSV